MVLIVLGGLVLMAMLLSQGNQKSLPAKKELNDLMFVVQRYWRTGREKRNYEAWLRTVPKLLSRIRNAINDENNLNEYVNQLENALESGEPEKIFRALSNLISAYPDC